MTREEFNIKVREQYGKYKENLLNKTPGELIEIAWDIAKMQSIKNYLTESDFVDLIEHLYKEADTILNSLFTYEWNYDIPMWVDWDNMDDMVSDYIDDMEA